MRRSLLCAVVIALASTVSALRADDVDKAEEKLAKAREAYSTALGGIRDDVLKLIDDKDTAERKRANPDLAKLKAIKAERDALEKDGEMPKWIDAKTKDRIAKARDPLVKALSEAKAAYVRAKDDEKAAAIDKEIEQVKKGGGVVDAGREAFQKGSVWKGKVTQGKAVFDVTFRVTERDGEKFKARFEGENNVRVIDGSFKAGVIKWTTDNVKAEKGHVGQNTEGKVIGKQIKLVFAGPTPGGGQTSGTVDLVLDEKK